MKKNKRTHFDVCEEGSDHGHFFILAEDGISFSTAIYCKTDAVKILAELIKRGLIDIIHQHLVLMDINTCSLPNTRTPEVLRKIKKQEQLFNAVVQMKEQMSNFNKDGMCQN